ncbi:MAG: hypothetical protein AAF703_07345 [Cyanobacteria bacterium P01_D01_bin.105]
MLAYTHFTDLFYAPTPLEAAIFLTGFLMVLTLPTVLFGLADRLAARKSKEMSEASKVSES